MKALVGAVAGLITLGLGASFAAGCGNGNSSGQQATSSDASAEATPDAGTPDVGVTSTASGSGIVTGSVAGAPFGTVATALWAGGPDDPATTVLYLFSSKVACDEITTPGWDTRIQDASHVLEMKAFGTTKGTYTVVTTLTPAAGEASVNFTLSSRTGTPNESGAKSGNVTLDALAPSSSVQGSFSLSFGTSTLAGSFDAVFCPGGKEP